MENDQYIYKGQPSGCQKLLENSDRVHANLPADERECYHKIRAMTEVEWFQLNMHLISRGNIMIHYMMDGHFL